MIYMLYHLCHLSPLVSSSLAASLLHKGAARVTLWDKYQITTRALIQKDGKIQTMNNELTLQDPRPPAVSMQTTPSPTIP